MTISGELAPTSVTSQASIHNCILAFPQTHINARFLLHIDNFGSSPYAMIHLEIENENTGMQWVSCTDRLPRSPEDNGKC